MVHFYRNVFSHVPSAKIREVTHMLKAIHAQENRAAAREKAEAVIAELHRQRLDKAVDLVAEHIAETLTYYAFPDSHWIKIRTNNPLERIMKKIHRRTRVVGVFPDVAELPQSGCNQIEAYRSQPVEHVAIHEHGATQREAKHLKKSRRVKMCERFWTLPIQRLIL